jgi:hypothetical protein
MLEYAAYRSLPSGIGALVAAGLQAGLPQQDGLGG